MKNNKIGFLGLGSMGFPICHGLLKSGFQMIVPAYRKEEDAETGYSPLVPDRASKLAVFEQMVSDGAVPANCMRDLISQSDVILISMPTSRQVEFLVLSEEGILNHAKPGTIVIDLTSAEPSSTKSLFQKLGEKEVELLDAPISGGTAGSINQTLSVMVGGKEEVFNRCRPIFDTIGDPEKVYYLGPSGCGNTIKAVNNCMSACNMAISCEAFLTAAKAGIDPHKALDVINASGGRNNFTVNLMHSLMFPGKPFNFTLAMMRKDIAMFAQIAKDFRIPAPVTNSACQVWHIPTSEEDDNLKDISNLYKMYERWTGEKLYGIDE